MSLQHTLYFYVYNVSKEKKIRVHYNQQMNGPLRPCREHKSNNKSIQTQHFRKDKDEDHANKQPGLLSCTTYTCIPHYPNRKPCGQTTETHRETSAKVKEGPERVRRAVLNCVTFTYVYTRAHDNVRECYQKQHY